MRKASNAPVSKLVPGTSLLRALKKARAYDTNRTITIILYNSLHDIVMSKCTGVSLVYTAAQSLYSQCSTQTHQLNHLFYYLQ